MVVEVVVPHIVRCALHIYLSVYLLLLMCKYLFKGLEIPRDFLGILWVI